jgi:hypothetical protein
LESDWDVQLELPLGLEDEDRRSGAKRGIARWTADRAVDKIRNRFGWETVKYGAAMGISNSVPESFVNSPKRTFKQHCDRMSGPFEALEPSHPILVLRDELQTSYNAAPTGAPKIARW